MSYIQFQVNSEDSADTIASAIGDQNEPLTLTKFTNYLKSIQGSRGPGACRIKLGGTPSTATITFTGQPTAADTFVLNGVTFTAADSGATANQFNIGQQISEDAANTAAARVSAVQSTLTFTGAPAAGDTFTFLGYTFTALKNLAVTIASSTGFTVTLSSTTGMAAGDTLSQGSLRTTVVSVDSSTVVTVSDSSLAWAAGTAYSGTLKTANNQFYIGATVTATADDVVASWNNFADGFALATASNVAGVVTFDSTAAQGRAITCLNIKASVDASTSTNVQYVVSTSASGSVVTFTSTDVGSQTLLYTLTESLNNATRVAWAGGTSGTLYTFNSI